MLMEAREWVMEDMVVLKGSSCGEVSLARLSLVGDVEHVEDFDARF